MFCLWVSLTKHRRENELYRQAAALANQTRATDKCPPDLGGRVIKIKIKPLKIRPRFDNNRAPKNNKTPEQILENRFEIMDGCLLGIKF